ncbi:MAG: LysR family transcriptional regulator, partial [Acidimicrobiales bacterium]|nr:LysR family transcriptional regulator [Acidimicrobiales bacterium]
MIDVTLRQLEYAAAIAEYGHFGRAAEATAVSQPGISAQIRELERRLGVTLFERAGRTTLVTPAGAEIVDRAREVLRMVQDLQLVAGSYHGVPRGVVRVGAIPTMAPYRL